MNIFFGTKIPMFLNILIVRDSCDAVDFAKPCSHLKIKVSFHIERLNPELNEQVEHVNLSLHF